MVLAQVVLEILRKNYRGAIMAHPPYWLGLKSRPLTDERGIWLMNVASWKAIKLLSLGEKGPIIWQSCFTIILLQVAFYVKVRLCRS